MEAHPGIRIIAVPYDSGHQDRRMGAGPQHLLDNGLGASLRPDGRGVSITTVRHEREPPAEVATAFELQGLVSRQVRAALDEGQLSLVLSGNCNTAAIGSLAGAGPEDLGVVWFDAHGEFNTPETTTTGFIDGMGLAIAVGHCWKEMVKGVPGFSPISEENVVMAWVRAVDVAEQERFDASGVTLVGPDAESQGLRSLADALDVLRSRVGRVYVHLDLDVLDAVKVGKANEFATHEGMEVGQLEAALGMVRERFAVAAAGIASYDPSFDTDGRVLRAATAGARTLTRPTSQAG
jgi:arginase